MGTRGAVRSPRARRMARLPIRALYPVAELARAVGMSHRRLQTLLRSEDLNLMLAGRCLYVPLAELEEKMPAFWESIKLAEALLTAQMDG